MVDSISNWIAGSFLKPQTPTNAQNNSTSVAASRNASKAAKSVFDQLSQTFDTTKSLVKQPSSAPTIAGSAGPTANLERGSLIDILV